MERTQNSLLRRAAAGLFTLMLALALCLAAAPAAFADDGDLDEIQRYDIDVTPQTDGSLDITATVDWKVLDSDSEGPLEWVQIGLPNASAENLTALTDTISELYVDGSYAHITFDRSYYQDETVHFSYSWTQRYMYTVGDDGSIGYSYTPGWFDSAVVDEMSVTWNYGEGIVGPGPDGTLDGTDVTALTGRADDPAASSQGDGFYRISSTQALPHSSTMTVEISYKSWPAKLDTEMSAENYSGETYGSDDDDDWIVVLAIFLVIFVVVLVLIVEASAWQGGFAADGRAYIYVGGMYYPRGPHGRPVPGSQGMRTPPPGFHGMGGGSTHGGGGGRAGGGCACASSCACACACAGGGRAGCSAKNLYGAIHLPADALPSAKAPHGDTDSPVK